MAENTEYGIVPTFKPEEYVWLKQRLKMDLLRIDEDIIEMPTLIQQAGEFTATAIEIRDTAENDLKHTIANVSEFLRTTDTPKGKTRSETQIASEYPISEKVIEKQKELSTARLDASLWSTITESLRRKDSGIRVAADLLNSGFLTKDYILEKRRQEIRQSKVTA